MPFIFTDILFDEMIISLCEFLPIYSVISLNTCCQSMNKQIIQSLWLWKNIATTVLGETLIQTHQTSWGIDESLNLNVQYYRWLFFHCLQCEEFEFAHNIRSNCLKSIDESSNTMDHLCCSSGHTATNLGSRIVIIGGYRQELQQSLFLAIIDIKTCSVVLPSLTEHKTQPLPSNKLRHTSCAISTPSWLLEERKKRNNHINPEIYQKKECILVIGGIDMNEHNTGGVYDCLLLEFDFESSQRNVFEAEEEEEEEKSLEVSWYKINTTGNAPTKLWHHSCNVFSNGKKLICFGGDMPRDDSEFKYIDPRHEATHVYILDIEKKHWSRIQTNGDFIPSWRSLHVGVITKSMFDHKESLIIVGGCEDHLAIFDSGQTANFNAYSLDLLTMKWSSLLPTSLTSSIPLPRMRFAAEVYGRFLIVFGGHDVSQPMSRIENQAFKLDLLTGNWSNVNIINQPFSFPDAVSSQLAGGLLIGGISPSTMQLCPKFDFLLLPGPNEEEIEQYKVHH